MAVLNANRRIRVAWNEKLRRSERDFFCHLAGLDLILSEQPWEKLTPAETRSLTIAFRSVAELGDLCRYALGYQRGRA